jgi:hypothetical protein
VLPVDPLAGQRPGQWHVIRPERGTPVRAVVPVAVGRLVTVSEHDPQGAVVDGDVPVRVARDHPGVQAVQQRLPERALVGEFPLRVRCLFRACHA